MAVGDATSGGGNVGGNTAGGVGNSTGTNGAGRSSEGGGNGVGRSSEGGRSEAASQAGGTNNIGGNNNVGAIGGEGNGGDNNRNSGGGDNNVQQPGFILKDGKIVGFNAQKEQPKAGQPKLAEAPKTDTVEFANKIFPTLSSEQQEAVKKLSPELTQVLQNKPSNGTLPEGSAQSAAGNNIKPVQGGGDPVGSLLDSFLFGTPAPRNPFEDLAKKEDGSGVNPFGASSAAQSNPMGLPDPGGLLSALTGGTGNNTQQTGPMGLPGPGGLLAALTGGGSGGAQSTGPMGLPSPGGLLSALTGGGAQSAGPTGLPSPGGLLAALTGAAGSKGGAGSQAQTEAAKLAAGNPVLAQALGSLSAAQDPKTLSTFLAGITSGGAGSQAGAAGAPAAAVPGAKQDGKALVAQALAPGGLNGLASRSGSFSFGISGQKYLGFANPNTILKNVARNAGGATGGLGGSALPVLPGANQSNETVRREQREVQQQEAAQAASAAQPNNGMNVFGGISSGAGSILGGDHVSRAVALANINPGGAYNIAANLAVLG